MAIVQEELERFDAVIGELALVAESAAHPAVKVGARVLHRVARGRVVALLGSRAVDELTVDDVNGMVAELAGTRRKRETIRKSVKYLAAVLDEQGLDENPARSKRIRLPYEEQVEIEPPTSEHVEAVYRLLASSYGYPSCGSTGPARASPPLKA